MTEENAKTYRVEPGILGVVMLFKGAEKIGYIDGYRDPNLPDLIAAALNRQGVAEALVLLVDSAAAYIVERSTEDRAVWERNWLKSYDAMLEGAPNLVSRYDSIKAGGE